MKLFRFLRKPKINIEFCVNNIDQFLTDEHVSKYNELFNQVNVNYKEYECLSKCEQCKKTSYAVINGKLIEADDYGELLKVMKEVEKSV
ncbi:DUF1450 domain-containing protein [Alkalihalobacterium alkalinitrilicum]|uniref:DUF1450 domain-containing protein n=1 Tax=Alkalihalobacterium alkalinitrilicum TaxID=427920 RepID=UPI000994EA9C|nr:DUF1450 domain-containing protein [Alkalihalobacterium alkalinitrilicum]